MHLRHKRHLLLFFQIVVKFRGCILTHLASSRPDAWTDIGVTKHQIIVGTCVDNIRSFATLQHILGGTAKDLVITLTAGDPIALP